MRDPVTYDVATGGTLHISITHDVDGHPLLSYYEGGGADLKLLRCESPTTCSSPTIWTLDATGDVGRHTSITLDTAGHPIISYYDDTADDLKLARCEAPTTCNSPTLTVVDDGGGDIVGRDNSITLDAAGHPIISYHNDSITALELARCEAPTTCNSPTIETVDNTGFTGRYTSITLDADDHPIISYNQTNTALRVARCDATDCNVTDGYTIGTVDSLGDVGEWTSLVVGADGHPIIAYEDDDNTALKIARCNAPDCNPTDGYATATVDDADDVGVYTSMVLGADGHPLIVYYDTTNTALKLARCSAPDCNAAAGYTVTTLVDDGTVGLYNAITLGVDGLPLIGTRDLGNIGLDVHVCGNVTCSPHVTTGR